MLYQIIHIPIKTILLDHLEHKIRRDMIIGRIRMGKVSCLENGSEAKG